MTCITSLVFTELPINEKFVALGISFLALIIAFVTFTAQIKQNKKQREHDKKQRHHDKLSVRPIGEIHKWDYKNHIAVLIRNNGSGVLICNKLVFEHPELGCADNLIDLMPKINIDWSSFTKCGSNFTVRPGEARTLIRLEGKENSQGFINARDSVRDILKDIQLVMTYSDIYDDKIETLNEKLDSFGTPPKQAIRR